MTQLPMVAAHYGKPLICGDRPPSGPEWVHEINMTAIGCSCAARARRCVCSSAVALTGLIGIRQSPAPRTAGQATAS
jgi:hypothetical protein